MKIRKSNAITWRIIDGEAILLDLKRGDYYTLRGPAIDIWKLCNGKNDMEKIAAALASKYGISKKKCREDVQKFVRTLYKKSFIAFSL